jgi:signal transduction histidine kinase
MGANPFASPANPGIIGPMRSPNRWVCALITVDVAIAAAALALWSILSSDFVERPALTATFALVVGSAFVLSGLVAILYAGAMRIGALMIAAGIAHLLVQTQWSNVSLLFTLGALLAAVPLVLFGHLVLAFPNGELGSRLARGVVATGWFVVVALPLMWVAFADGRRDLCGRWIGYVRTESCPDNALQATDGPTVAEVGIDAVRIIGFTIIVIAVGIVVHRWRTGTAAWRHATAPVLWTGGAMLVLMAVTTVDELLGRHLGDIPRYAFLVVLAAVPIAFLVGLVRSTLERSAVAGLVVRLTSARTPQELRDEIAGVLRDPSLEVAYRITEEPRWADGLGREVTLPAPDSGRVVTLVESNGAPVAALIHERTLEVQRSLVDAVAGAASLALVNQRLQVELHARVDELRVSRERIIEAGDQARRSIERNLHDGTQQRLVSISMALGLAESRFEADPRDARRIVGDAKLALGEALRELREMSQGVHPGVLTERGLGTAVKELAYSSTLPIAVRDDLPDRLPQRIEVGAYYVVAEALANASKHAAAEAIEVALWRDRDRAMIRVSDDGVGGADPRGSGLRGLADRVEALGGRLWLTSASGGGTTVEAVFPCGS